MATIPSIDCNNQRKWAITWIINLDIFDTISKLITNEFQPSPLTKPIIVFNRNPVVFVDIKILIFTQHLNIITQETHVQ